MQRDYNLDIDQEIVYTDISAGDDVKRTKLENMIGASATESRPKYQQVRDHFHAEIRTGRLAPGQSLPTESELMESLGLSRYTIRQAMAELESDGIISRTPGRGTFVTTSQERKSREQLDMYALIAPELREGFYPSLVHGFEQASSGFQHQVLVSNSGNDTGRQGDLILQMIDRSVGGVALVPTTSAPTPAYQIRQLQKNHIPVVFCHRTVEGTSAPCLTWSGYDVGFQCGVALQALGHRRVGFAYSNLSSLGMEYDRGLRAALGVGTTAGNELIGLPYQSGPDSGQVRAGIRHALEKLSADSDRATAIFCGNIGHAEQIYLQAEELGLKIPRDLSLIAFGGTWRGHGLAERITCAAVDEHKVGARAAELLREMRAGKRPLDSDERIEFPVTMLPGDTLGPNQNQS